MNSTMRLRLSDTFWLNQNYLLNAEYQIFDFTEERNVLNRAKRIDTDLVDTLFSFAYLRLRHNFIFQDTGVYRRESEGSPRKYQVASEAYDQTLSATVGVAAAPGVRFLATQSLRNYRSHDVKSDKRTLRNYWTLTIGAELARSVGNGGEVLGSVRHIGAYDEGGIPNKPNNEEAYWIAGVTFQKRL
jgi:hypothetical protein